MGFVDFELVRRFDCFRETTKEKTARELGVEGVNVFARKRMGEGKRESRPGEDIGKYTLLKTLGRGRMGPVYLAEDRILGRKVIMKVLPPTVPGTDEPFCEAVIQSVRLMAQLEHPNIAGLHEVGVHDGFPYLATQFVEGRSLAEIAGSGESLSPPVFLRIMAGIAGALQHAHERKVVHRDIKPANICVSSGGEPMLMGFEIACPSTGVPSEGEDVVLDSPFYMSPEQAGGQACMPCSDIWNLGATMYEILCGSPPYAGETPAEVPEKICSPEPVDLSPLEGKTPEFVIDIVGKCLKKDRAERYQSADELKRALEAAIDYVESSECSALAHAPPRPGQTLLLHVEYKEADLPGAYREYEIGEQIGGGTYGVVFRATEKLSGKDVAIKILRCEHIADADAVARFRREATLLSRLSHPNIVRVYNFGRYSASFFIAMDLLGKRTLGDVMVERGPMDEKEVALYAAPVLAGLKGLHEAGVVHRDLKPENIAVADGRVVVFDFGMACARDLKKLTMTGMFLGTPSYASPEQAAGLAVTGATDVYAVGVMLYEMLSDRLPHEEETTYKLLQKIATEPPVPIGERCPQLSTGVRDLIDRMLEKEPEKRPKAAEARRLLMAADK